MNFYDIDAIINFSLSHKIDISPADRKEWRLFCCALKVLGYDESTFVALSSGAERDSHQAWRAERNPHRYKTAEAAKGMIVNLAKAAGIDVKRFSLSPDRKPDRPAAAPPQKPAPPAPPADYIPMANVTAAAAHGHESGLFAFIAAEFGEEAARQVFAKYFVGGSKYRDSHNYRAAVFPYISADGKVIDCKIFHIDAKSGSRKDGEILYTWTDKEGVEHEPKFTWAIAAANYHRHRRGLPPMNRAPWCNFGDHLLTATTAEVCLVESEKTALIAALVYPERTWIAVGSKQNLTAERCKVYAGKHIILFPDRDGYKDKPKSDGKGMERGWRTIARMLANAGYKVKIDTTTETYPCDPKDDIADIIIRQRHGKQLAPPPPPMSEAEIVFEDMKRRYPHLAEVAELLELEATSIIL